MSLTEAMRARAGSGGSGGRAVLWLLGLMASLVLLYMPFTTGNLRLMAWSWPLGGVLLFLSVRGIGAAAGEQGGDRARTAREDEVGRWLGQLGGKCQVMRYVTVGGRSVEFVVVAPSGVYAIHMKSHNGKVSLRHTGLTLNGRPLPRDFIDRVNGDAAALEAHLTRSGLGSAVKPLLVFTDARVDVREADGVTAMPLRWLESFIRTRPQALSSVESTLVGALLRREARATITQ